MRERRGSWLRRVAVATSLVAALCANVAASGEGAAAAPDAMRPLVAADNALGFRLLAELLAVDDGKNICISPLSIAIALQMTANGAGGETASEMTTALQLGTLARDDFNRANEHLYDSVTGNKKATLRIANAIFARRDVFDKAFLKRTRDSYAARVETLDFADPKSVPSSTSGAPIVPTARSWKSSKASIRSTSPSWSTPSISRPTGSTSSRRATPRRTISRSHPAPACAHPSCARAWISRASRARTSSPASSCTRTIASMIVFVPDAHGGLASFCARLTPAQWADWTAQFHSQENAQVVLPRFTLEYESVLNSALEALGMKMAFAAQADFGPMLAGGKRGLFISEVRHKTYVSVDEVGTEAAAVTSVRMTASAVIKPYLLIANKPFFYAICDDTTGAILFMGIVNDPRAS